MPTGWNTDDLSTTRHAPSAALSMFRCAVATDPPSIRIRTDELRTVREAMRDFGSLLTVLEEGEVEKLVLTQRNQMRAVVVSVERWSEVEQALAAQQS
jgi:hypothetical protein